MAIINKRARTIRVFEHEKVYLEGRIQADNFFYPEELEKLHKYNDQNNNIYFTSIHNGIKFNQYVGVIQIGQLTIEILPKADKNNINTDAQYDIWHNVLIDMLKVCKKIDINSVSESKLKRKSNSILDLYFQLFIDELLILINRGLIKQYRKDEGNLNTLKGRLNFSKNIQKNLIRKEKFYTSHNTYDQDYIFNQILLRAIVILRQISSSNQILESVRKIYILISEISIKDIYYKDFEKLK